MHNNATADDRDDRASFAVICRYRLNWTPQAHTLQAFPIKTTNTAAAKLIEYNAVTLYLHI